MAPKERKEGDPLKMYTVVMALLVGVMLWLYFTINKEGTNYETANQQVEAWMTGKGRAPLPGGLPVSFPELANDIERMSNTLADASGGAAHDRSISDELMKNVATQSRLVQTMAGSQNVDTDKTYKTVRKDFEYRGADGGLPRIWDLLGLLYRIEGNRLYRVTELSWQMADEKDDPEPPYDLIKKPKIEVAIRFPIKKGER